MQKCHNLYWKEYNPCPETPCSTDLPYTKSKTDQLSYMLDCILALYDNIYTFLIKQTWIKKLDIAVSIYTHAQGIFSF